MRGGKCTYTWVCYASHCCDTACHPHYPETEKLRLLYYYNSAEILLHQIILVFLDLKKQIVTMVESQNHKEQAVAFQMLVPPLWYVYSPDISSRKLILRSGR